MLVVVIQDRKQMLLLQRDEVQELILIFNETAGE